MAVKVTCRKGHVTHRSEAKADDPCEVCAWVDVSVLAERARCAKIADEHLARVQPHSPDRQMTDLVAQGYGNAALNIAAAIRGQQ